jgi:hypothetical protein
VEERIQVPRWRRNGQRRSTEGRAKEGKEEVNLKDARDQYYTHSGSASAVGRQLAFAGLALVWIFKATVAGADRVPPDLLPAATLLALTLGFDLLQYALAALLWGVFQRKKELEFIAIAKRGQKPPEEFKAPRWINWPALAFFSVKLVSLVIGYGVLLRALVARWVQGTA